MLRSSARMRRRDFLRWSGLGAAGLAAGSLLPRLGRSGANEGAWGDYPASAASAALPAAKLAKNVLEVFVLGGLCPWETFYAVDRDDWGKSDGRMWFTFQDGPDGVPAWYAKCGFSGPLLQPFRTDENGVMVNLGPFAEPLRSRKDIVARLRLHVMSHDLFPHPPARILASMGATGGSPRLAGLGCAVQHHAITHAAAPSPLPYAYGINAGITDLIGLHPSWARPLQLTFAPQDGKLPSAFQFAHSSPYASPAAEALAKRWYADYAARLTWPGALARVRSATLDNYDVADQQFDRLGNVANVVSPSEFAATPGNFCGAEYTADNTRIQLRLAAHLLTHPGSVARYVTVHDQGYADTDLADAYDFHTDYVRRGSARMTHLWSELIAILNEPGENDPTKLNLDETLVVVTSEFGRDPLPQGVNGGRNHYPGAYVTLMFGGPIGPDQQGIVGAIDNSASPVDALRPAETRAAILAALGIWPFEMESFAFGDIGPATSELDAATRLKEVVLGVTS